MRQDIPSFVEKDLDSERIVIEDTERDKVMNKPYPDAPQPSNADNTAVDPMGNIHSGSAIPDPIGDVLEGETPEESFEYQKPEVLDEDPILGSPQGVANQASEATRLENIADEEENILDKIIPLED